MRILVTGSAGFIGFHLAEKLARMNHRVTGMDNINNYYDTALKLARLEHSGIDTEHIEDEKPLQSRTLPSYTFIKIDLCSKPAIFSLFEKKNFDCVINLAAQAGVRYSIENPEAYIASNITGFFNILEAVRHFKTGHLVFASSSSVYGLNEKIPFSVSDKTDSPVSLYAATKKSNELLAFSYSHLYSIPMTGLRFFTVYGPWGRPDMAPFIFTKAIIEGKPIKVFNNGSMKRDFTYIDDVVEGIVRIASIIPEASPAPFGLFNIGYGQPVDLLSCIETIETCTGKKAEKQFLPMQAGDVPVTWAETSDFEKASGYKPKTGIDKGIPQFVNWYTGKYLPLTKVTK
ncbi:MAG: NAD-dependent epimerase/dehydratase family protein [Treponema sp.]|jgi:UDP-glucuronate 4-epimerase|nr:NAD-dependent epimerase/dehydratase family protein [Treponema sp.]